MTRFVYSKYNVKLVFFILISLCLVACTNDRSMMVSLNGKTMGTTYNIKFPLEASDADLDTTVLQTKIDEHLLHINQLMSTYIPDSELSLLNKADADIGFVVSTETQKVLEESLRLNTLSKGALDITVGPLVNLWGFGPDKRPDKVPSQVDIDAVKPMVGIDKFRLEGNTVYKAHADVYIDLSTIAKGYAVDELAFLLEDAGINDYLVEIGGEMRVSGKKLGGEDWALAIEKPITAERSIQRIIAIGDNAIASSGDYRNYFEQDGVRFSHLIDPQTSQPIQHNLAAVSVVASTSMRADGLATALIIMGAEKGRELAEQEGIAALFITKEGGEFKEYRSTAFDQQVSIVR